MKEIARAILRDLVSEPVTQIQVCGLELSHYFKSAVLAEVAVGNQLAVSMIERRIKVRFIGEEYSKSQTRPGTCVFQESDRCIRVILGGQHFACYPIHVDTSKVAIDQIEHQEPSDSAKQLIEQLAFKASSKPFKTQNPFPTGTAASYLYEKAYDEALRSMME